METNIDPAAGVIVKSDQTASRGNTPAFLFAEVASSANGPALEV